MPMMALRGVRISWLVLARKALLARLAVLGRLLGLLAAQCEFDVDQSSLP
jgi:hypothetical protein